MNQPTEHERPKRAVLYMRAAQDLGGHSTAGQLERCRAYADAHGYTIIGEFTDTGRAPRLGALRPGYQHMVECATAENASAVVVADRTRISRCYTDYLALRKTLADIDITVESAIEPWGFDRDEQAENLIHHIAAYLAAPGSEGVRWYGR